MRTLVGFIADEIGAWGYALIRNMPGRVGRKLRCLFLRGQFRSCGSFMSGYNCRIDGIGNISLGSGINISDNTGLFANEGGTLIVGDRVSFNTNVFVGASNGGEITIGNDVLIGPNVVLRASNHRYEDRSVPINRQGHQPGRIVIEDDVWIGANAVILDKAVIRRGAIVAAGAVVKHEIPAYSLAGGVPAKVLHQNFRL